MVNRRVRANIQAALLRAKGLPTVEPVKPSAQLESVRCIVESLKAGERTYTIKELADKHGLDVSTIYRQFRGRLGCFRVGKKWLVTDTAYTAWLTEIVVRAA